MNAPSRRANREFYFALLLPMVLLVPFLLKPFTIDEPLYIWTAKQIHAAPFEFCGFNVNWYSTEEPATKVITNPPLTSYCIALIAAIFGWSELPLHAAFLLPAMFLAGGIYRLSASFGARPLLAVSAAVFSPVFLISSTTVMCDTLMVAFYVWSIEFWRRGLSNGIVRNLIVSACLVSAACMTKYFAVSLIPLLFAYSLISRKLNRAALAALFIPIGVVAVYHFYSQALYGQSLLSGLASFSGEKRAATGDPVAMRILIGLSFTGGSLLPVVFILPLLSSWKTNLAGLAMFVLIACITALTGKVRSAPVTLPTGVDWELLLLFSAYVTGGTWLAGIAVSDYLKHRSAESLLLLLWISGTFVFATFLNWGINGRSILPMAPPAAILLARLRHDGALDAPLAVALALSLFVAIFAVRADFDQASAARIAAERVMQLDRGPATTVWFQGHWGFQYYMELSGAKPLDVEKSFPSVGDILVMPSENANVRPLRKEGLAEREAIRIPRMSWFPAMYSPKAGFYSDLWGPLPFSLRRPSDELYTVLTFR